MNPEKMCDVLLCCALVNYGLLLWWFLLFTLAHDWSHRLTGRWFRLSVERYDGLHFAGMMLFKIGIILFNLVPYVALRVLG